jgi:hypothetical protein
MNTTHRSNIDARRITDDDGQFFFAYYDKLQFDPSDRYVLAMKAACIDRAPKRDDALELGMIDLHDDDQWIPFDSTSAWCWQQGCMLQWIPNRRFHIIYNIRGEQRYESIVRHPLTSAAYRLPRAIYALHPGGNEAICNDFARVNHLRPGYGYEGFADPNHNAAVPDDTGLWRMNLNTGQSDLIINIAQAAHIDPYPTMRAGRHWFNHALYNPDGSRFVFLHRWECDGRFLGRMITAAPDGSNMRRVFDAADPDSYNPSHFWWIDAHRILLWAVRPDGSDGAYRIVDERTGEWRAIDPARLDCDGHMSICPTYPDWMLSDTYPDARNRRCLFLYHLPTGARVDLGAFDAGPHGQTPLRCDLHPRWNRAGTHITIDSVHEGFRGIYLLDVSPITAA